MQVICRCADALRRRVLQVQTMLGDVPFHQRRHESADAFAAAHAGFAPLSCRDLLASQRIELACAERLRLWPHVHGCDGFFAAAFERRG